VSELLQDRDRESAVKEDSLLYYEDIFKKNRWSSRNTSAAGASAPGMTKKVNKQSSYNLK